MKLYTIPFRLSIIFKEFLPIFQKLSQATEINFPAAARKIS